MSHPERKDGSHKPLFGKSSSSNGDGGNGNSNGNSYNNCTSSQRQRASSGGIDSNLQNFKNEYGLDPASCLSQQQELEVKLRKIQTRLKVLFGIVVVGFIILMVVCGTCFFKLHQDVAHHTHKPTLSAQMAAILEEGVCVSCEDFRLGPSAAEEDVLSRYIDESSGSGRSARCCADTGAELLELLTLFIERKFRLELAKGTVPGTLAQAVKGGSVSVIKPAAHLMIDKPDLDSIKHIPGRQQMIKKWRSQGDMTFLVGGAEYNDGHIVVPTDGYYFVYCQIAFTEYDTWKKTGAYASNLSVYLYRHNILYDNDGEETLAINSITKGGSSSRSIAEYVISLGAVFKLRRQDHLLIKVSNLTDVDSSPKRTYFGFFKI